MRNNKYLLLFTAFIILFSLVLAAIFIPIETKSVKWCNDARKIRYSIILGQENEFEEIEEWPRERLFNGGCLTNFVDEVNLYIL